MPYPEAAVQVIKQAALKGDVKAMQILPDLMKTMDMLEPPDEDERPVNLTINFVSARQKARIGANELGLVAETGGRGINWTAKHPIFKSVGDPPSFRVALLGFDSDAHERLAPAPDQMIVEILLEAGVAN